MMEQVGKYQLVRKLATGGMAEVYLAKASGPMGFEKTLVLKRILPHLAEEPAFVQMFLTEAKLAARLTHSHIAQIFDFGEVEGDYFLAMEYIDGPSLRTLLKRATFQGLTLPPTLCARLVAHACEGLAFAHDFSDPETHEPLCLIHRDISPDNILLSRQGEVKVVDFGIAKAAGHGQNTEFGTIKGKISYMSPEQLRFRPLDCRADVYALGVVFYELLTGRKPFEGTSDAGLMQNILQKPPAPLNSLRPELPAVLQSIIDQALAKDREQRYANCLALQSDLEEFILSEGRPVTMQSVAQLIQQLSTGTGSFSQVAATGGTPRGRPGPAPVPPPVAAAPPAPEELEPTPITMMAPITRTEAVSPPFAPDTTGPTDIRSLVTRLSPVRKKGAALVLAGLVLLALVGVVLLRRPPVDVPRPLRPPPPPTTARTSEAEPGPFPQPPAPPPAPEPAAAPPPAPEPAAAQPPVAEPSSPVAAKGTRSRRTPAPAQAAPTGLIEFRIWPYATVYVNGKSLGDTPLAPAVLPVGQHEVKIVNQKLAKTVTRSIRVRADRSTLVKINLLED